MTDGTVPSKAILSPLERQALYLLMTPFLNPLSSSEEEEEVCRHSVVNDYLDGC